MLRLRELMATARVQIVAEHGSQRVHTFPESDVGPLTMGEPVELAPVSWQFDPSAHHRAADDAQGDAPYRFFAMVRDCRLSNGSACGNNSSRYSSRGIGNCEQGLGAGGAGLTIPDRAGGLAKHRRGIGHVGATRDRNGQMSTFVLVHPAWFGGWCWTRLARLLRAQGHSVHAPTLTGLGDRAHLVHPGIDLRTHVEDIVNVLTLEDLGEVILLGTSSAGMVITGVAERVPERIGSLVYLDAFVPDDGQCLLDLIPPDRRPAMETLVESEGFGWLLPRLAAAPWEQFVAHAWQVTNDEDLAWTVTRLRPTPFGHFTRPVQRRNPAAERLPRIYIRCGRWPNPGFDQYATIASETPGWRLRHLDCSHLPYITHTRELAQLLHELVEAGE